MNILREKQRLLPMGGYLVGGGSGGGGGPTSSTVTQSNIPDWLRPQVEGMLGAATQQLFTTKEVPGAIDPATGQPGPSTFEMSGTKPFTPYSANPEDYQAGFSPLQTQVQQNAANLTMPNQFNQATGMAGAAGGAGMGSAQQALGYGGAGFQSGQGGQNLGVQGGGYYGGMGAGYGQNAAGLANPAMGYGGMGAGYGGQAANLAGAAMGYGQNAADIGAMGLQAQQYGQQVGNQAQNYAAQAAAAQQNYAQQATNPNAVQAYMSPYVQNVVNAQNMEAQRNADIAAQAQGAQAARSGAFGGGRDAIMRSEAARNLATLKSQNQAAGLQSAYSDAMKNMQFGSNLGLQGLAGANTGLNTALAGGQLGLSGLGTALQGQQGALSGLGQAGSMYGLGMQGAQMGLSGVNAANQAYQTGMQGANTGLAGVNAQLAGTAQGMQGAQTGLQGVTGAQAGYGLGNAAAGTLGSLGGQQLNAQSGILNLQNTIGAQQQAQQQAIINNAINNFAQAQQQPLQNLTAYNSLLRGYAIPGQTTTQYQAAPSAISQLAGLGTAAYGASKLMGASGGSPKDFKKSKRRDGLDTLGLYNAMKG